MKRVFQPIYLPSKSQIDLSRPVLMYEAWDAAPHFETGLEISLRLAAAGYEVKYIHVGSALPYVECFMNRNISIEINKAAEYAKKHNITTIEYLCNSLLSGMETNISLSDTSYLKSISSLKKLRLNDCDVGISVASSLLSIKNSTLIKPCQEVDLCKRLIETFFASFYNVKYLHELYDFGSVVVFNGRFACISGAVDFATKHNIPVFYHERGASKNYFSLTSFPPHDRESTQKFIFDYWNSSPNSKYNTAKKYFVNLRKGNNPGWISFAGNFRYGLLRQQFSSIFSQITTPNIVYFTSSSAEFESVSVDTNWSMADFEWSSQFEAIRHLAKFSKEFNYNLIIRVHPNINNSPKIDKDFWNNLLFLPRSLRECTLVVPSNSKINSYELLDNASLVVCYGSTIGIEAVYWDKPVLLLGKSFYDFIFNNNSNPKTCAGLKIALSNIECLRPIKNSALPFGYYQNSFGIKYKIYSPLSLFHGKF